MIKNVLTEIQVDISKDTDIKISHKKSDIFVFDKKCKKSV